MNDNELEKLKNENERLKRENEKLRKNNDQFWAGSWWITKKIGGIFLGGRLSNSINDLVNQVANKNVSSETIGNVITHILWRFTKIGIFTILIAFLPTFFAILQIIYMRQQNKMLDIQNKRIEQQTYLQEAERRSSYIFLMSNIYDKINDEIKNDYNYNKIRDLSPELIGGISALSEGLKPYKLLEGDSLSRELSPERGQLLIMLIRCNLNEKTYDKIYAMSDFSYSDLSNCSLAFSYLEGISLDHANLNGADLYKANLKYADITGASLNYATLVGAEIFGTRFLNSDLLNAFVPRFWIDSLNKANINIINKFETDREKMSNNPIELNVVGGLSQILRTYEINTKYYEFYQLGGKKYEKWKIIYKNTVQQ